MSANYYKSKGRYQLLNYKVSILILTFVLKHIGFIYEINIGSKLMPDVVGPGKIRKWQQVDATCSGFDFMV